MNPYLMDRSSKSSTKPLKLFSGKDPEYSVEYYLNAVRANLILNMVPEPVNTPLHQNWMHRRTALFQATLDGEAQKLVFSYTYINEIRLEKIHARILRNV